MWRMILKSTHTLEDAMIEHVDERKIFGFTHCSNMTRTHTVQNAKEKDLLKKKEEPLHERTRHVSKNLR